MAKPKGSKSSSDQASGVGRAASKPAKKNPKPNNYGANGKTKGGYSPAKLAERELRRKYTNVSV